MTDTTEATDNEPTTSAQTGNSLGDPPRISGDWTRDANVVMNYIQDLVNVLIRTDQFLQAAAESETGDFDPGSLPDPATATVASAQQTANAAFTLAAVANAQALRLARNYISSLLQVLRRVLLHQGIQSCEFL